MDESGSATVEIRAANPDDAGRVNELLVELGYPYSTDADVAERIAGWIGHDDRLVLVAARDGDVVGVIALAVIPYFERHGSWGRVVALVTDSRCRGLRIGRRLLDAAERASLEKGCISMELSSSRRRTDAHAFYRHLGYHDACDKGARFVKDLVPGASDLSYSNREPDGG